MKDENIKKGKSMLEQTIKNKGEIVSRLINSDEIYKEGKLLYKVIDPIY